MSSFASAGSAAGSYVWSYKSGSFPVTLRPNGVFFCKDHMAPATWTTDPATSALLVDWSKYGKYAFTASGEGQFEGSIVGNADSWRKMKFVQPLTPAEALLLGEGGGSVWDWEYAGGTFEVEFICDSYNHFVCKEYPAHSHWSIDTASNKVAVEWDKYGSYDLVIDPATGSMSGSKRGQEANWRKLHFKRPLAAQAMAGAPAHDHEHQHVHSDSCNH